MKTSKFTEAQISLVPGRRPVAAA